ncbi:hypothetical protein D3C85_1607850 [compost metagenome]
MAGSSEAESPPRPKIKVSCVDAAASGELSGAVVAAALEPAVASVPALLLLPPQPLSVKTAPRVTASARLLHFFISRKAPFYH